MFKEKEINRLFDNFKEDYFVANDSKMLNIKMENSEYENIKRFILKGML